MRILHVMDHSLPGTDGYAIRAKYLLEAQVAAGHVVTVLTSPSQGPEATDTTFGGVSYCRAHYTTTQAMVVRRGGKHLVFGDAIGARLSHLLAQDKYDIVHAHTPFTVARSALRESRRRKIPLVYEKRNLWEESARARGKLSGRWPFFELAQAMDRHVTRAADAVCTITEALRTRTIELGLPPERIFVVGNGVDTVTFSPRLVSAELRNQCARGGDFVVGFIGSFFSFEGLPMLLRSFAKVKGKYPGARLVLVGDGEDRPILDQLVAELGLVDSVWLVGRVPHDRVLDFYAAMDVLVYPRLRSPLTEMISPLKPLEPMAMGRCVLGSNVGGIRELVRDGDTGLLFEADSELALEERLVMLLSRQVDTIALGDRARAQVIANRQWKHMAQAYDAAYGRAREPRSARAGGSL